MNLLTFHCTSGCVPGLLESACMELDLLLAEYSPVGVVGNTIDKYVSVLNEREHLKLATTN